MTDPRSRRLRRAVLPTVALAVALAATASGADDDGEPTPAADGAVIVFLVRHAEKALDGTRDPELTAAGERRAAELARVLVPDGRGIDRVHSTDYRRTRGTAAPTAEALGLEVELYDPRRLDELAAALRAAPGRHLVVGHSDTTPALVERLGGEPGEPTTEDQYDRLWIVVLPPGGPASTVELRYGAPSEDG